MDTIEGILNSVLDTIYERGENYYHLGNILEIINSNGNYTAEVEGSNGEIYTVNIEMNSSGKVKFFDCDCPYDYSPVCKHIVAVLLAIQNNKNMNVDPLEDRLNELSKEQLISILTDLCRDYKIKEKEYEKLLDLVKRHRHLIERCFKSLAKYYPKEAYTMYSDFIAFSAKQAASRPEYQSVCQKIAVLYNEGGKKFASDLIVLLKTEYNRRPAFQDELNQISKKLTM